MTVLVTEGKKTTASDFLMARIRRVVPLYWAVTLFVGLAYGSDGAANIAWADLRHYTTTPQGKSGYTMNVDYARFDD